MAFNKGKGNFNDRGAGKSFGRDREGGSGRSFGGGGRPGGTLELFDVTCAQCGKHTQVPFKPTGARPVLCRDCFTGGNGGGNSDGGRDSAPRQNSRPSGGDSSRELREINEKLDKIMNALDIE